MLHCAHSLCRIVRILTSGKKASQNSLHSWSDQVKLLFCRHMKWWTSFHSSGSRNVLLWT